jgi:predicted AlkP superfamily pyrophosphatase or phosphodiesterase
MRRLLSAAALAAAASVLLSAAEAAPRLIVLVVIDQMRADYVDRFHDEWSSGLRRLVDEGAWFTHAAYPYLTTVTCAGHATISTGAYPHTHGIIANVWFDRDRKTVVPCTDDSGAHAVPYGKAGNSHTGPANLMVPSLADEVRGKGGHVVTLALKARSAIMLAGHGGDAVTWISEDLDSWESSSRFTSAPIPQVQTYVTAHPLDADFGKSWTRLLPVEKYHGEDAGLGEAPSAGWTSVFPHVLTGEPANTKPDTAYYDQWQHSPYADAYVARMAGALVESMQLGKHASTDFLGVSFSSPDLVGHGFGPNSQEIEDMYARLDQSIGGLLAQLDRVVGAGQYVIGLSADHGVTPIPEQLKRDGRDAGRISAQGLLKAGEDAAEAQLGHGSYLASVNGNEVYFQPEMYERASRKSGALEAIVEAIGKQPGIRHVFTSAEVRKASGTSDPLLRAAALSYMPGRSGDLLLSDKAGWVISLGGTTHGSATPDDQRVPVLLFGRGVKRGHYDGPASPADVAPTLASLAGIPLPKAEGHPLSEALR